MYNGYLATSLALISCFTFYPLRADSYTWNASNGFWDEPSNWLRNGLSTLIYPTFLDIALIEHNDAANRQVTFRRGFDGANHPTVLTTTFAIGNAGTGTSTLLMSEYGGVDPILQDFWGTQPHELNAANFWVGNDGNGNLVMTGGTLSVYNELVIGKSTNDGVGNTGTADYAGQMLLSGGDLFLSYPGQVGLQIFDVGAEAPGEVFQSGGHVHGQDNVRQTLRLGTTYLQGNREDVVGRYNLSGGNLDIWGVEIGKGHRGEFIQTGGLHNVFQLNVGDTHATQGRVASGFYQLSGGTLQNLGFSTVVGTNGAFEMSDGNFITRSLIVEGEFNFDGGLIEMVSGDPVRIRVSGTMDQTGGMLDLATGFADALKIDSGGVYTFSGGAIENGGIEVSGSFLQTGGNLDLQNQVLRVNPGGGWVWQSGTLSGGLGRIVVDGLAVQTGVSGFVLDVDIGEASGSTGNFTLSGNASLGTGTIDIGTGGTGTLDVQTSGSVSALNLNIGQVTGSNGTAIVRSGTLAGSFVNAGAEGTGLLDIRGGAFNITNELNLHNGGELRQSNGLTTTPILSVAGNANLTGGRVNATSQVSIAHGGVFTWDGELVIDSSSPATLPAGSAFTPELRMHGGSMTGGKFIASGGVLNVVEGDNRIDADTQLDGTSITNSGVLRFAGSTLFNGAFVDGTGSLVNEGKFYTDYSSFSQPFTNSGELYLDADNTIGSVSVFFNDAFTQDGAGRLILSALDPLSLTSYDSITFGTWVTLAGTFELVLEEGFVAQEGTELSLLNFAVDFSDPLYPARLVAGSFDQYVLPALGGNLTWDTSQLETLGTLRVSVIPEPSGSALLIAFTGAALALKKRKGLFR